MPDHPSQKPQTEFEGIAAQFATAKAAQASQVFAGRSRDEQVKRRNQIALRDFKYTHGLLVVLLLSFFYLHVVGIFLFTKGFLLTRLVLDQKSSCAISPLEEYGDPSASAVSDGCWHPRTFEKAVVVIIDALRYDFTVPYVPGEKDTPPQPFHNAFTTPYRIASEQPENAVLLPFIADPPTTTLQRLKGLTTGTLPTFIDAGSNFAGNAIDEDNIISQMKTLGKRMAFMGDDTWMALFPGIFEPGMEHPYESLNVWDLHTVDNGVNEHIFPLLDTTNSSRWDVLFAHYLGVDHAGHRYGPDHPAMTEKLKQMDQVVQRLTESVDDKTLLVVMGDHGMDSKGDHGGESRGEVEAALWMYSKQPVFGRLPESELPKNEMREVAQIDLVPTLSLLLGLPIPFNNLGAPIAEAFLKSGGAEGWKNLAQVSRLTAAQIKRYQRAYSGKNDEDIGEEEVVKITWEEGQKQWVGAQTQDSAQTWLEVYGEFSKFQVETLRICKNLWARFNLVSMGAGIAVLLGSIGVVLVYARSFTGDRIELTDEILTRMRNGLVVGTAFSLPISFSLADQLDVPRLHVILFGTAVGLIGGFASASVYARRRLASVLPDSGWGVLSLLFTVLNSVMFGSNSFTIWEDQTLIYFICTFAIASFVASQRNADTASRTLGTYHSIMLLVLTRLASLSRLCREEQMPYCTSTFYASATSSVSAPWTLFLLFVMALFLPSIIASFYAGTKSYHGAAVAYIGWAFRLGLFLNALYWTLDSADNGSWLPAQEEGVKVTKRIFAQIVLGMSFVAGHIGFGYASPCLNVEIEEKEAAAEPANATKLTSTSARTVYILGYANVHGTRYFLLLLSWSLGLLLLQKPMGALSLGILLWQILTVLELLDVNDLSSSSIGPVILALLGNSHFFSTGHQAALSSIQWDAAFIPITTIRYPWSPLLVLANTLAPQILTALAVPLVALWKAPPKTPPGADEQTLGKVARAATTYVLFQTTIATATVVCAAWLRRHLMLYRIFSPRFMLGAVTLLLGELVVVVVGVGAVRWNLLAIGEVFGFV